MSLLRVSRISPEETLDALHQWPILHEPNLWAGIELARVLSDRKTSTRSARDSEAQPSGSIEDIPSLDIYSAPHVTAANDATSVNGFCELKAGFSPHGVHCDPGKDYHGTAYMDLSGPGINFHGVDEDSIRVRAESESDIITVDGRAREAFGGKLQWQVNFTIKSGPGFKQQGANILWTVRYKCNDETEAQFPQTLHCL